MNSSAPNFDFFQIFKILIKYKKVVVWTTLAAAVVSIVVSLLLPNYFKSQAVFYPKGLSISDRSVIFSDNPSDIESVFYGSKHDANRILSLGNSSKIVDYAINYFNLAYHYGYDTTTTKYWRTKVRKEFNDNFSIIKTDKDALEITLYDTDKNLCALIVNTLVNKIDEYNRTPYQENKAKVRESINAELFDKEAELEWITNDMVEMRKEYNIVTTGSKDFVSFIGDDIGKTELFKVKYFKQQNLMREINDLKKYSYQYEVSAKNKETSLSVLESAYPAEKKSKPIRWLIVVLSTLLTFITISFSTVLYDRLKKMDWSEEANS